jgi:hypothetical protein
MPVDTEIGVLDLVVQRDDRVEQLLNISPLEAQTPIETTQLGSGMWS